MATATASHSHTAATQPRRRDWRAIGFRGVALLIAFFVLGVSGMAANLLSPWKLVAASHPADYTPELHRWHGTDIAALLAVLVCGSLLALFPRPRRAPLLAQFIMLSIVIFTLSGAWPYAAAIVVPGAIIALLFVASYPDPRALVTFSREGAMSLPLAAFAALAAIPLLGNAWTNLRLQHTDMTEHAHNFHWSGSFALALILIAGGFLVASRRPGWRALGVILGVAYLYLSTAALAIPEYDGSWGVTGGVLALIGGVGFLGLTIVEGRRIQPRGR